MGWYERPHEQLVKEFKDYIQEQYKNFGGHFSPEEIIKLRLDMTIKEEREFFFPLALAWDAIAYDRYKPDSLWERLAGATLHENYQFTHEPTIKLSHPQIRIIDALAEAVGIPPERWQAENVGKQK